MIFTNVELSIISNNKDVIKSILNKKYDDIIAQLLLEKDAIRSEVLKLWAKECKDLTVALDNIGKKVDKIEGNTTGI
ncbi:hypothetical protein M0R04_13070 [Candidatus Dojkabacteria bacterium]|jgi:hypothetical protein|nr:hypothetical protein [Candidatus Dojkabacteria bacterium]